MSSISIPVINVADLHQGRTLRALDNACRTLGVFQVVGHGLSAQLQQDVHATLQNFFALPKAEKQKLARTENNHWGYYDKELTKNRIDLKEIYDYGRAHDETLAPQWPSELPTFKAYIETYFSVCETLALQLLSAIAENLGVDNNQLQQAFQPHNSSFLRLNYYPLQHQRGADDLGIHPHTDAGAITVLLQDDQAGLEVFAQDQWHLVEPIENTLTINLGDIVQVWSNDRYRAPLHRVIASQQRQRYSAAFFLNPQFNTVFQPLPSTLDSIHSAKYRAIAWSEFRSARAKGDYHDQGKEIQISDYRL